MDLKENLLVLFTDCPEVSSLEELQEVMWDEGEGVSHEREAIRAACEELVIEGVLQRAGREGYEATEAYMAERDQ